MEDPAAGAVVLPGHLAALVRELADHAEERLGALGEVADLGRPVVHLGVDVGRVFRIPHGIHVLVPDPLEVGRLRSRTRGRDEKVAAELEDEGAEGGIVRPVEALEPFVGREQRIRRRRQGHPHPAEQAPVLVEVGGLEGLEGSTGRGRQDRLDAGAGIAADVLVIDEVRRRGDEQGHGVGAGHAELVPVQAHRSPLGQGLEPALVAERPRDTHVVRRLPADDEPVGRKAVHPEIVGRVVGVGLVPLALELGLERDPARPVGREPDDEDLVHGAREDLPDEADAVLNVFGPDHGGVKVELMPVLPHGLLRREPEDQPAEGLVFHLLDRITHQVAAEQDVGQVEVAVENELPDLGQGLGAALDDRGIRPARPIGLLVELDLLLVGLAEDHGPEPAVADGQGVLPLVGGVAVPKPRRGIGPGLWPSPGPRPRPEGPGRTASGRRGRARGPG